MYFEIGNQNSDCGNYVHIRALMVGVVDKARKSPEDNIIAQTHVVLAIITMIECETRVV